MLKPLTKITVALSLVFTSTGFAQDTGEDLPVKPLTIEDVASSQANNVDKVAKQIKEEAKVLKTINEEIEKAEKKGLQITKHDLIVIVSGAMLMSGLEYRAIKKIHRVVRPQEVKGAFKFKVFTPKEIVVRLSGSFALGALAATVGLLVGKEATKLTKEDIQRTKDSVILSMVTAVNLLHQMGGNAKKMAIEFVNELAPNYDKYFQEYPVYNDKKSPE